MLKKRARLTTKDIESLSLGKSVFGTLISLRFVPAPAAKISVSVSKKTLPRAVDRNKVRRRTYAASEKIFASLNMPAFIMIMPKKEVLTAPFSDISTEIEALFRKAGLLA